MKYKTKKTAALLETVMEVYHGISKQKAKQIIGHSNFLMDGKRIEKHPKLIIEAGRELEIVSSDQKSGISILPSRNNPVAIYYEDEFILIALKPPGLLACESRNQKKEKSFHKLLEAFLFQRDEKKRRLWVVHRLDKEVEGLILFAKSEEIQEEIIENWPSVSKKYLALTENKPPQESGFVENWLREGPEQRAMVFQKEVDGSKFAKTEYLYLKKEKGFHLLEITLHTGRKNQIRAQLAGIGCPIVGDRKYGADDSVKRQVRLAAYKMEFLHPVTGKQLIFEYKPISRFFNPSKNEDENYKIV